MHHRVHRISAIAAAVFMLHAAPAAAQEEVLTITLRGAPAGTTIAAVVDGARQVIGRVGAAGTLVVNAARMNAGKGHRVAAKVDSRGQQPQVVLHPEGQVDPECRGEQRQDDSDCSPIGTFVIGDTKSITITLGGATPGFSASGSADPSSVSRTDQWRFPRGALRVGATLDATWFHAFTKTVGQQSNISDFDGENSPLAYGGFIEYRPGRSPFAYGVGVRRTIQDFSQTYQGGPEVTGQVKGWFFDTRASWIRRTPWFDVMLGGGLTYARDVIDLQAVAEGLRLSRTHNGLKGTLGVAADFSLGGGLGGRTGVQYTTSLQKHDADEFLGFGLGIWHNFRP